MAPHFRKILELSRILFTSIRYFVKFTKWRICFNWFPFSCEPFPFSSSPARFLFFPLPSLPTTRRGRCGGERHKLKAALRLYADNSHRRILAQQSVTWLRHALNIANGLLIVAERHIVSIVYGVLLWLYRESSLKFSVMSVVIFNNYSSSSNGLWVNSRGLLTQRPWGREE